MPREGWAMETNHREECMQIVTTTPTAIAIPVTEKRQGVLHELRAQVTLTVNNVGKTTDGDYTGRRFLPVIGRTEGPQRVVRGAADRGPLPLAQFAQTVRTLLQNGGAR